MNIAGVAEEISAFLGSESFNDATDPAQQAWNCVLGGLAQMRLEFAEGWLDGVKVGANKAADKECRTNCGDLVNWQIVHDDDVAAHEIGRAHV